MNENEVYQAILKEMERCEDAELRQSIADKIRQAEKYREMRKMSDLLSGVIGH